MTHASFAGAIVPEKKAQSAARTDRKEAHEARKDAHEARKDAHEARKDAHEATKEAHEATKEAHEATKEAHEATKEAAKETREVVEARHKRQRNLLAKAAKGSLSEKEKLELAKIRGHHRELHREAVERWTAHRSAVLERRRTARRELLTALGDKPLRPKLREELQLNARRVAHLERAKQLAEVDERAALSERIDKVLARETARHAARMTVLKGEK